MLYRLNLNDNDKNWIEPVDFYELADLSKIEKDLENLLAENLLDNLFEDNALMPIYQERPLQSVADIYALTMQGDLVIFELKRGIVGDEAMVQILRYAQWAGQWSYDKLDNYFKKGRPDKELSLAHQEAFELDRALTPAEFNRNQHLFVVGNAANEVLAKSLDYWKTKGISVEFIPYRIYKIADQHYFEFFSKPHDLHKNPRQIKGVILDTNVTYDKDGVWHMLENNRASICCDGCSSIHSLNKNDFIFLSHRNTGIIAAGQVTGKPRHNNDDDESFVPVKWLTNIPKKSQGIRHYMPFSKVTDFLEHGFYWARTLKTPYLSQEESKKLLTRLNEIL